MTKILLFACALGIAVPTVSQAGDDSKPFSPEFMEQLLEAAMPAVDMFKNELVRSVAFKNVLEIIVMDAQLNDARSNIRNCPPEAGRACMYLQAALNEFNIAIESRKAVLAAEFAKECACDEFFNTLKNRFPAELRRSRPQDPEFSLETLDAMEKALLESGKDCPKVLNAIKEHREIFEKAQQVQQDRQD